MPYFYRANATKLLKEAEQVNNTLNKTQDAQIDAEKAIEKASEDYKTVEKILGEVRKRLPMKINLYQIPYLKKNSVQLNQQSI